MKMRYILTIDFYVSNHLRTGEGSSDRDRLQQLRHLNRIHPAALLPLRCKAGDWSTGNGQEGSQGSEG